MARRVPLVVLHFRIEQMAEVLFSGFESELYGRNEMPFLYWYIAEVLLSKQLDVLGQISQEISASGPSYEGTSFMLLT